MLDEPLTGLSLQALDLDALSSSHHWSIRPCSARFALVADSSSFSTSPTSSSSPRSAPPSSSPAVAHHSPRPSKAVDPRIMLGLDWVVGGSTTARRTRSSPPPSPLRRILPEHELVTIPPGGARYPLVAIPSPRLHSHLPRTRSRRPQLQPLLGARRRASLSQSGHHTREGKLARSLWTAARRSTLVVRSSDRGRLASPPRLSTSARSPCCAEL
mgnify:CR=1 FL=1